MSPTDAATDFDVKRLDEMDRAFGGSFIRVRASLGVSSFGMQVFELPANSGDAYPEHDHNFDGQEEVYLLLEGQAELHLPGRVVKLDRDTFVRVGPSVRRRLRTGPQGARMLVVGATPGAAYKPASNSSLGGPETIGDPTASSSIVPGSPPPQLD